MSEHIKITVVMNDEKLSAQKDGEPVGKMMLTQESALTLMPVLLGNGLMDGSFCGGRGDCGRCVVQFLKGAPLPTGLERSRLEPEELRQGYRLACVTRPKADCTIRVVETAQAETPIVTDMNLVSANINLDSQQKNLSCYIIAVDLGTTTIAMQLRDAETGAVADTYCEMNPAEIWYGCAGTDTGGC